MIGVARAAYEYARDYAKERTTFGDPIIEHPPVAYKLADMALEPGEPHELVLLPISDVAGGR